MPAPTAVLRLLLIVCTLCGVWWMHTFGHAGGHTDMPATSLSDGSPHQGVFPHQVAEVEVMLAAAGRDSGSGMGMVAFAVCVAVLASAGFLLVLRGWAMARRHVLRLVRALPALRCAFGRGPPRPHGLWLADLSVQRM